MLQGLISLAWFPLYAAEDFAAAYLQDTPSELQ